MYKSVLVMGSYRSVTDILCWALQLLNSAFAQTVLETREGRETNSSSSPLIEETDNQRFHPLQGVLWSGTGELQGHLQEEWQRA